MSGESVPASSAAAIDTPALSLTTSSLWDRISTWASENKAIVYTITGVAVVVTGAGAVYYFSDSSKINSSGPAAEEKRKSKKDRRKEKKKQEDEKKGIGLEDVEAGTNVSMSRGGQTDTKFSGCYQDRNS